MKSSPEYNNLQYGLACAKPIELNLQRMTIYKNVIIDNIRKKRKKKKKKEKKKRE